MPVGKMNELANGINNTAQGAILCSWFHTRWTLLGPPRSRTDHERTSNSWKSLSKPILKSLYSMGLLWYAMKIEMFLLLLYPVCVHACVCITNILYLGVCQEVFILTFLFFLETFCSVLFVFIIFKLLSQEAFSVVSNLEVTSLW